MDHEEARAYPKADLTGKRFELRLAKLLALPIRNRVPVVRVRHHNAPTK